MALTILPIQTIIFILCNTPLITIQKHNYRVQLSDFQTYNVHLLTRQRVSKIILNIGPGNPSIMGDAFRWQRPCITIPLTYNWITRYFSMLKHIYFYLQSSSKLLKSTHSSCFLIVRSTNVVISYYQWYRTTVSTLSSI